MRDWMKMSMAILLAAALCGCSTAPAPVETQPDPTVLRVTTFFGDEDGNRGNYEAAVAEFQNATGVIVEDNSDISNEEWKAKILADFETGSEADVLYFFANADAEPFIRGEKVVSVEEIRESCPGYAGNMDMEKMPQAFDGRHYAVPIMGYWEYLYVNRDVLEACGIPMPGTDYTWEQFLADCETVRDYGYTPIACSLSEVSHYWFEYAVMNNGTAANHLEIPTLDGEGHLVDDAVARKWIAALGDIQQLYERHFFPSNTLTAGDSETAAMFGEGKAAFLLDGSWKAGYFTANFPDRLDSFDICHVPAKGERQTTQAIGGISTGFFITRKAWEQPEKRQAAVEFVSTLTSDHIVNSFVTTEITALAEHMPRAGMNPLERSADAAKAQTTGLVGAVQDTISGEARSSLFGNIQNVVTGKMTARDAVETAMQFNN